jgi:5-methylcytosine-specific restriction protein A
MGEAHPRGLMPSRVPLTIVCGPPCAGKTRFCDQYAGPGDLIIDLDLIAAELANASPHAWSRVAWLTPAIERRNALLKSLSDGTCAAPRAWFIVGAPEPAERDWWARLLRPERVVVIATDLDTCLDRLFADPEREATRANAVNGIHGWWQRYSRRSNEEEMRGGS